MLSLFNLSLTKQALMGFICGYGLTLLLLSRRFGFLPHDQGRAYAINGELSRGKLRGVGIIMVIAYLIISLLFVKISLEYVVYAILLLLIMLSGYLDDAADVPWSDYKKGAIDFVISLITMACFVMCSPTDIMIFHMHIVLPKIVYGLLGIILIWVSINVVNCTDGVDGLCGNLTLVSLLSFVFAFSQGLGIYNVYVLIMCGVILAYLYYNSSPSSMLMGDAGSRAFGYFLALIAMKSQHPFAFIIFALVMIIDGGLGLVKIFIIRFFHIKGFMRQIRTPIHDEMRKKRSWQDPLVVARFTAIQIVLSALLLVFL